VFSSPHLKITQIRQQYSKSALHLHHMFGWLSPFL